MTGTSPSKAVLGESAVSAGRSALPSPSDGTGCLGPLYVDIAMHVFETDCGGEAGYAATFASEASMAIRANANRGAVNPIPRHARVTGSPAGNGTSVRRYLKTIRNGSGSRLFAAASHSGPVVRPFPREAVILASKPEPRTCADRTIRASPRGPSGIPITAAFGSDVRLRDGQDDKMFGKKAMKSVNGRGGGTMPPSFCSPCWE